MSELKIPHHFGPEEMPNTSRFLTDEEYRLIQNNIVIGCTDVLIVDESTGEALSGFRRQKPQEGYWFSCGGRMERGQSYQEAGAAKIKEELGLDVDPARLEFLTAYSTAFKERAQEPREEGSHTSNAVVTLFVTPEERAQMELELNKEHEKADWVSLEEIASRYDTFPPILRDAIKKVEKELYSSYADAALNEFFSGRPPTDEHIHEVVGYPEKSFIVPEDHVFFSLETKAMQDADRPWHTSVMTLLSGEKVPSKDELSARKVYQYERDEGLLLAPGENREVTTFLAGIPVTSVLSNKEGSGMILEGRELPQSLVDKARVIDMIFMSSRDIPTAGEALARFRVERQIRRRLRIGSDYSGEREAKPAAYMEELHTPDGKLISSGRVDPYLHDLIARKKEILKQKI